MARVVLRPRGVDLHFPDILAFTKYTTSPVMSQRDSEVVKAQQLVKQYFEENFALDNPDVQDLLYFYTASDQIVKAQQQCETSQCWQKTSCDYTVSDPFLQLKVEDYTGLVQEMYGSDARTPILNSVKDTVEKLEESVQWLLAQTQYANEFLGRLVCCSLLFSNKLQPEVHLYVNGSGEASNKVYVQQEMSRLAQDLQQFKLAIQALDFTSFLDGLSLRAQSNAMENTFMTILNQQFAQLITKLGSTFAQRYLPAVDNLCKKSLLGQNTTVQRFLSGLEQAKDTQLKKLAQLDVYQNLSETDQKQLQQRVLAEFNTIADRVSQAVIKIRVPEGTSVGEVCAPLLKNITDQLPEVVQTVLKFAVDLLQQFYYTAPKFPEPGTMKLKCVNYLLKQAVEALEKIVPVACCNQSKYAELQRSCFNLNLDVTKFLEQSSKTSAQQQSSTMQVVEAGSAEAIRFGALPLTQGSTDTASAIVSSVPERVSLKLQSVLQSLKNLLFGGS